MFLSIVLVAAQRSFDCLHTCNDSQVRVRQPITGLRTLPWSSADCLCKYLSLLLWCFYAAEA